MKRTHRIGLEQVGKDQQKCFFTLSDLFTSIWSTVSSSVLEIQDISINVEDPDFELVVQQNLAQIFDEGHLRERLAHAGYSLAYRQAAVYSPATTTASSPQRRRRRKRYATVGNATVQVVEVQRGDIQSSNFAHVDIVYYLTEEPLTSDVPLFSSPSRVTYLMHLFTTQEVAIRMGYPIVVKVERKTVTLTVL